MPRLYLIRHAKPVSVWGEGDRDPGLDETGRIQAQAAREWLSRLEEGVRPRFVVSSPLRRCRETAQPTADRLGVSIEVDAIVGEIPTPAALPEAERPGWLRQAFSGGWSDIEGDLDYAQWRRDIVASLARRGHAAVFSHYVAINAVVSHLLGEDRVLSFRPDHASITVLETDGRGLTLVAKGREAITGVL